MTTKEVLGKVKELLIQHNWIPGTHNGDKNQGFTLLGAVKSVLKFDSPEYWAFVDWLNLQCKDLVDLTNWSYFDYRPGEEHLRVYSRDKYLDVYKNYNNLDFYVTKLGLKQKDVIEFLDKLIEEDNNEPAAAVS